MAETAVKTVKKRARALNTSQSMGELVVAVKPAQTPAKSPQTKNKTGRPSTYNADIARQICELLSDGVPLREICRMENFPAWRTVYGWKARDPELSAHIAGAREIGYDYIAEDCLKIADTPEPLEKVTTMRNANGEVTGTATTIEDDVNARKLRIWTRMQLLAKWAPDKYGDRVALTGVEGGAPITGGGTEMMLEIIRNLEMSKRLSGRDKTGVVDV